MASPSSSLVFFLALLSIAAFSSMPSAEAILGVNTGVVGGTINCPSLTTVIPNAPVQLVCGSASLPKVIASATTDISGTYSMVLSALDTILFDPATCHVSVTVPAAVCPANIPNNILNVPVTVFPIVQLPSVGAGLQFIEFL